jgi:hypothetical protein
MIQGNGSSEFRLQPKTPTAHDWPVDDRSSAVSLGKLAKLFEVHGSPRPGYAAFSPLKCCSNKCRIRPAAVVPHLRSASSLAFNG